MYLRLATHRRLRPAVAAALIALAGALTQAPAAQATGVELTTAYAAPIAASNAMCNAEPRAFVDGTKNYDASKPLAFTSTGMPGYNYYVPPNVPSYLDLAPTGQAGSRADLCAGVSFTPDVEPPMMRSLVNDSPPRVPDTPEWADVPDTHVVPASSGDPQPVGDDPRSFAIDLPAGYQAQFTGITPCSAAQFAAGSYVDAACPASSQVGDGFLRVSGYTTTLFHSPINGIKLYVLDHTPNEFARIGLSVRPISALAPIKLVARVVLAPGGSGALELVFDATPRATYDASAIAKVGTPADITDPADPRIGQPVAGATARQLYLESVSVRLWGSIANHSTLAANVGTVGSTCASSAGLASATTYGGGASTLDAPSFTVGGCGVLSLPAASSVTTAQHAADTPTGATVAIDLPQPAGTLAPALAHAARIAFPTGLDVGAQVQDASGFALCTADQFAATSRAPSTCPAGSRVGATDVGAVVTSDTFTGSIYLGAPVAASPTSTAAVEGDHTVASIFVEAAPVGATSSEAPRVKLTGRLVTAADGTTALVFDDLPAIRFTHLQFAFADGATALFTTPQRCGDYRGTATVQAGGIGPQTTAATALTIDDACDRAPAASLALTSTTAATAQADATGITLTRSAGSPAITSAAVALPPGVLVSQTATAACDAAGAAAGMCPDAARIGSARLLLGASTKPVAGTIYRTDAPDATATAGAVLVSDPLPGDLNLGRLTVPLRFDVQSADAVTTMTAQVPTSLGGARLDLRTIAIDFDQAGAVTTPTACGPLPATATITTPAGATAATVSTTYAACPSLAFQPGTAAQVVTDQAGRTRVATIVTGRAGDASLRSFTLTLPTGVTVDGAAAARACSADQFQTGSCPAAARVGAAAALLSVAPDASGGDLDLVAVPGQALPGLGVSFAGPFAHRITGQLVQTADGRVAVQFAALPDLPITRLGLTFDGGAGSLFAQPAAAACTGTPTWTADLTGQGGQTATSSGAATCPAPIATGAGAAATPATKVIKTNLEFSMSVKTGLKLKLNRFSGRTLQSVKLTLPAALRFDTKAVKAKGNISAVVLGAKVKTGFTGGSLTMTLTGGSATEAVIRVRPKAYFKPTSGSHSAAAKNASGKTQKFRVRLAFSDGSFEVRTGAARLP